MNAIGLQHDRVVRGVPVFFVALDSFLTIDDLYLFRSVRVAMES